MAPELSAALKALETSSLAEWADQYPTLGMVELARRLPVPAAPITLVLGMAEEARARGTFSSFARGWMVRVLNDKADCGVWGTIFDAEQRPQSKEIWRRVEAEREAHPAWLPQSQDDARLPKLFAGVNLDRTPRTQRVVAAFNRIDAIRQRAGSKQALLDTLAQMPRGYRYVHAVRWVDAQVANGGFEQVYQNGGAIEVPFAIDGLTRMGREDLAAVLQASLASSRSSQPQANWAQLDQSYLALPHDNLADGYAVLLESLPQLFEPTSHEFKHPTDGRGWKVSANGAVVEIQITLEDGTVVTRERKQATPAAAEAEMEKLIGEQEREGFLRITR